jgi:hypothetical protein
MLRLRAAIVAISISSAAGCYSINTSELKSDIKPSPASGTCLAGTQDVSDQVAADKAKVEADAVQAVAEGKPAPAAKPVANAVLASADATALLVPDLVRGAKVTAELGSPGRTSQQKLALPPNPIANVMTPAQASADAVRQAVALSSALSPAAINARFAVIESEVPQTLKEDKVFRALYAQAHYTANRAQATVASRANISTTNFVVSTPTESSDKLSNGDFKAFLITLKTLLTSPDFAVGGKQPNGGSPPSTSVTADASKSGITFKNAFIRYFKDYYDGTFVDRSGTAISKPTLSLTISDTEIGNVVQVMWELILDYTLTTPVWTDGTNYYPGPDGQSKQPTVVHENLVTAQSLLPEDQSKHCGITKTKAEAIWYLTNTASDKASALGGVVTESFGGFSVGLGFLGKFSFGDNQTLQTVIKTSIGELAGRAAEEASYRTLYWIPYNSNTFVMEDLVQQFLDAHSGK